MSYIAITLNHMRAVKAWADAAGADTQLDVRSFELEVKCRNRYYRLRPRFLGEGGSGLFHTDRLADSVTGFIGWLPYGFLRADLADDKLAFKSFAAGAGLRVPAAWSPEAPGGNYILKRSAGSFGDQITGPFRQGEKNVPLPSETPRPGEAAARLFAEQFIEGDSLKVWFWGGEAFFAHRERWPRLRGDGQATLASLLAQRLGRAPDDLAQWPGHPFMLSCLAYQGLAPGQVLAPGREAWIDFRYGRALPPVAPRRGSDNQLDALPAPARAAVDRVGQAAAARLEQRFQAPVLFAVDGVVDAQGEIWWLELNSSPVLPPEGYGVMFDSLFGVPRT